MNFLQQLQEQFNKIWTSFSKTQKMVVGGISFLVLGLLLFLTFFLGKTNYEPLYPNLDFNDSAMIATKLKDMKIDYRLDRDGTTILVPTNLKHQLRLDLANQLPQGGVIGFESFNETKFGETDTDKRIRYLAALQGELTRTIQQMAEVESAKVHVVLPEESLFIQDNKPTTASVLLKLKPYSAMDPLKVRSIIYFLAHSVEGLLPENVTVIDVYGNLLSEGVIKDTNENLVNANLTVNQITIKKKFEDDLSLSLQSMLEKVLGPGKAVVRASVELDFDQVETSTEEFGNNVVRSEQLLEQISEGTAPNNLSIVGAESNLTDMPSYPNTEASESSSETSEITRNYEIDRFLETRKKAPGEIKRLSVAVIIDGQLTVQEETNIQNIIAGAAGLNESRGDVVSITSLAFNNDNGSLLQEQLERETARQYRMDLLKYGIVALGIIALLILIIFLVRKGFSRGTSSTEDTTLIALNNEQLYNQLSPEEQEKVEMQKNIEKIAKTQPESIAKVVRTWMAED